MPELIENKMALDWPWDEREGLFGAVMHGNKERRDTEGKEPGWEEIRTGVFVPEVDAFKYALERISNDEDLKQEFVEWFYSGNWVKEEQWDR